MLLLLLLLQQAVCRVNTAPLLPSSGSAAARHTAAPAAAMCVLSARAGTGARFL
jgi:hypothetical protein